MKFLIRSCLKKRPKISFTEIKNFPFFQFFLAMTIASLVILTSSPHLYTSSLAELRKANQTKMAAEAQQSQTGMNRPVVRGEH